MRRILSSTLPAHVGETVRLEGWVHRRRRLAAVTFLVLRDRAGLAQVVVAEETARRLVEGVGEESVVRVTGTVTANPKAPGGVEVTSPAVEVLSTAQTAAGRAVAPDPRRLAADAARPRPDRPAAPAPAGRCCGSRRRP